jgi:CDP-glycerol glycerophosphotransferase (TagB/SpsB family)
MHHKRLRNYNLFNVCSKFEKNIIINNLGYKNKEVVINGFPRWDRLYKEKKFTSTILIMPTWRNDLANVDDEFFIQSNYFKFWNSLLNHKDFKNYINENNIKVNFFIHVVLNRFIKHFNVNSKYISFKNDENIQDLLLNCGMLITDYSSVSFDVLFQNKPVIYAPFDFEHMVALRGGGEQYIDYEKDLPGPICKTADEVINSIIKISENGWKIDRKHKNIRKKWFKYIDANNSKRVYRSIKRGLYPQEYFLLKLFNIFKR